jgi:succinyl-CoA synthetase beta subunit
VAATFKGIIQAVQEAAPALKAANVRLFVRRGGPNYQQVRVVAECCFCCCCWVWRWSRG